MKTPGWWWRSVILGFLLMVVFRRLLPDVIPWPDTVPERSRAPLLVFAGIALGALIETTWWAVSQSKQAKAFLRFLNRL